MCVRVRVCVCACMGEHRFNFMCANRDIRKDDSDTGGAPFDPVDMGFYGEPDNPMMSMKFGIFVPTAQDYVAKKVCLF